MFRTLITAFALLTAATSLAETIPLANVWAIKMPKTRDIGKLDVGEMEGKAKNRYGKMTREIIASLGHDKIPAGPGFAVAGTSLEALKAAHEVLVRAKKSPETVSGKINLVFFTLPTGADLQVESIERDREEITIRYRFITRGVPILHCQFALIPMGLLPQGKYRVDFKQLPTLTDLGQPIDPRTFSEAKITKMVDDTMCKPFAFEVK